MTTIEIIAEMDVLLKQRHDLQDSLARARCAGAYTGNAMSGQPRAKTQESRVEKYGTIAAVIAEDLKSVECILMGNRERVRKPIEAIPDVVHRTALRRRYLDFAPVREIALEMGYKHRESMYRLIDSAVQHWLQGATCGYGEGRDTL